MDEEAHRSGLASRAAVSEIRNPSDLLGYLIEAKVSGRSGSFRIAVFLDERLAVKRATVLSYPWSRGREVRKRSFTSQFEGKGLTDAIEVGKDIDAVTGATISCEAMARGVRDAVRLLAKYSAPD
jgi:Na+-translocating ferredoxin:NAD+ oxidoreductase RnfG subunit